MLVWQRRRFWRWTAVSRDPNICVERVNEIYRLFKKHQFQIADLRSFEEVVTDEQFAEQRKTAVELKANPARFAQSQAEIGAKLANIPVQSKGVKSCPKNSGGIVAAIAAGVDGLALLLWDRRRRSAPVVPAQAGIHLL